MSTPSPIYCTYLRQQWEASSVHKHFSFQRFLHLRNPQKPIKTRKPGNLETYVQIPGNLSLTSLSNKWWKPKKPTENHRKLMKWAIYNQVHVAGFLGFRFPSFRKLENQWKPVETRKLFCLFTDDLINTSKRPYFCWFSWLRSVLILESNSAPTLDGSCHAKTNGGLFEHSNYRLNICSNQLVLISSLFSSHDINPFFSIVDNRIPNLRIACLLIHVVLVDPYWGDTSSTNMQLEAEFQVRCCAGGDWQCRP